MRAILSVLMVTAGATALYAQAIIEYGATAGRSAAAATGAAGAGKSSAKIFDKVNQSLAGGGNSGDAGKRGPSGRAAAAPMVTASNAPVAATPAAAEQGAGKDQDQRAETNVREGKWGLRFHIGHGCGPGKAGEILFSR